MKELCRESSCYSHLPYIPPEMMVQVMARLPAKSLMRFMSLSKSWYSMIHDDSQFAELHRSCSLTRSDNKYFMTFWHHPFGFSISFTDDEGRKVLESIQFNVVNPGDCGFLWPGIDDVAVSKPLDGLLCIYSQKHYHALVLNLSTRQIVHLPMTRFGEQGIRRCQHYLCLDPVNKEYKVLNIFSESHYRQRCEVYTLGTASRRILMDPPSQCRLHSSKSFSCSVNGAIYWSHESEGGFQIVVFDASKEEFRVARISELVDFLKLVAGGGQLLTLHNLIARGDGRDVFSLLFLDPRPDQVSVKNEIDNLHSSFNRLAAGKFSFAGCTSPGDEISVLIAGSSKIYLDGMGMLVRREHFKLPAPGVMDDDQKLLICVQPTHIAAENIVRLRDCGDAAANPDVIFLEMRRPDQGSSRIHHFRTCKIIQLNQALMHW